MENENITDNNEEIQDTGAVLPAADSAETPAGASEETTDNTEQKEIDASGHDTVPEESGISADASGDDENENAGSTDGSNASMSTPAPEDSDNKEDTEKDAEKETDTGEDTEKETVSGNSLEGGKDGENPETFSGTGQDIDYEDLSGIGEGISAILSGNETYHTESLAVQKEIHEELQHVSFLLECTFAVACAVGFLIALHVGGKLVDYFWERMRG